MHLLRLELHDYRSYERARVELAPGPTVLVGDNAQGKTNLLEAVHYLAIGGSHRVAGDAPLVRAGAQAAVIRAVAMGEGGRTLSVEAEIRPGGSNHAKLNGQAQPRFRDALGVLRSVLFAPEDLVLVRGDPADRRRFLDELLAQRRPAYHVARREYDRVLRQRNVLLRSRRAGRQQRHPLPPGVADDDHALSTWTDALVATGTRLLAARIAAAHALSGPAATAYGDLVVAAPGGKAHARPQLAYQLSTGRVVVGTAGAAAPGVSELAEELRLGLQERSSEERERGMTLVGPHRDDLLLSIGELPAKGYASHGEAWSLALALRLAAREVLAEVGDEPVVLLDDVFAELDEGRRAALAGRCGGFEQVLVTAAVDADVPLAGPRHEVRSGTVTMQPVQP